VLRTTLATAGPLRPAEPGRLAAARAPRGAGLSPRRDAGPLRPTRVAPPGPIGGRSAKAAGPPVASGGSPPAAIGERPAMGDGGGNGANATVGDNGCERHGDRQHHQYLAGHGLALAKTELRGRAPAWIRRSPPWLASRAQARRAHAWMSSRCDQGESGTKPHTARAGTAASAMCRR